MGRGWRLNRRTLFRSWLVCLLAKRSLGSPAGAAAGSTGAGIGPVSLSLRGFARATAFQRRYRMDATILLLGAPLFTRRGAGGAYASVEISGNQGSTARALQFAAGSSPERVHGLNRFGILREAVVERGDGTELSFAGLMTRSGEESFEQGRKALLSRVRAAEGVVARGTTFGPTVQTWIDNIALPPDCDWSNVNQTLGDALRLEPSAPPRETASGAATTFLHAMREAALCSEAAQRRQFIHAGKLYWLETRRQPERPWELVGAIHDLSGARRAEFRASYAAGDESGIPVRIEYRPRSFLRLTFEAEQEATEPSIHSLFNDALFQQGVNQEESA